MLSLKKKKEKWLCDLGTQDVVRQETQIFHEKKSLPVVFMACSTYIRLYATLRMGTMLSYHGISNITMADGLLQEKCKMFQNCQLNFFVFYN